MLLNESNKLTNILRCPACYEELNELQCSNCGRTFSQTQGILDLRWPQPVAEEDTEVVEILLANYDQSTFQELVMMRFEIAVKDSDVPQSLIDFYQNYHQTLAERGQQMIDMFQSRTEDYFTLPHKTIALDIGCGVGASSLALAKEFEHVVGIDPSLPSLLLAKKYFSENEIKNVTLVQAYAQHLPIRNQVIDFTVAQNVLEHLFDVETAFHEIVRVLMNEGCFCGDSRNRYDLFLPEPHAQIRWVGCLPRRWQSWYVSKRRQIPYDDTHLLSKRELEKYGERAFGGAIKVTYPLSVAYGRSAKWDTWIYRLEKVPLLGNLFLHIYPSHLFIGKSLNKCFDLDQNSD